jgi:hypothetical protein
MATLKDKQKYIDKARATEDKYNIPPYTLVGLLETESNFDPNVISGKKKSSAGDEGIAQFMPLTSKAFKIDPYNTDQAIDAAGKYLSQSYKSLGNWNDSILSYNMGVQGVKNYKGGKKKLVKEQREYVGKVLNNQAKYVKTKQQPSIESYKQENKVREAVKDNIPTNNVKYLDIPKNNVTFASVPEMAQKQEQEVVDQDIAQVEQQTNESLFLDQVAAMQYEPQEEEQPNLMTTDVTGMYNYASNFVESPLVAQQGEEIQSSDLPDPINGVIYDPNGERTYYDDRLDRIVLTPSSNFAPRQSVINHEKFHKYQFDNLGSNYEIVNEGAVPLFKKPSMVSTDEEYYKFHNRKGREIEEDIKDVKSNYPQFKFVPNEIMYNRLIDREQYSNPYTFEGEAQEYENSLRKQQGGEEIIDDNRGQYNHPGKVTRIKSPFITMKDVPYDILAVANNGEKRMMKTGEEHYFEGATEVVEYPQLTEAEKQFLKEINKI